MNQKTDMQAALQACVDALLHDGVPTDPEHPKRIALNAAESALACRPDAQADERGAFEAWWQTTNLGERNQAWHGWKARAAAPQAEAAPEPKQIKAPDIILTGAQLLEALDFIAPDRDSDQLESEAAFAYGEGHSGKAMYVWCADYPEEGSFVCDGSSAAASPKAEAAQGMPEGWKLVPIKPTAEMLMLVYDPGAEETPSERYKKLLSLAAAPAPVSEPEQAFQARVKPWMLECFGSEIAADKIERNHRFFEEAGELVQACGMTSSEAHQLVDYTWGRPVGEKSQEVGGVMVTLAALCLANGLDMHAAGEVELARISAPEMMAKIRAKQAAKPKHSPLPEARAAAPQAARDQHEKSDLYKEGCLAGKEAAQGVPAGWRLMPPSLTQSMRMAMGTAAAEYMKRTGGNSLDVIYEAGFAAAPDREHEVPCAKLVGRWDYGKPGCVRYEPDFPRGDIPEGTPVYVGSATSPDREQVGEACIAPACHQWDGTDRCTCQRHRTLDTLKRVATALPVLRTMLATEGLGGVEVADEMLSDIRALLGEKADAPPSRECGEQQECPHGVDDGACGWCYGEPKPTLVYPQGVMGIPPWTPPGHGEARATDALIYNAAQPQAAEPKALYFKRNPFRNGWTTFNIRNEDADEVERRLSKGA